MPLRDDYGLTKVIINNLDGVWTRAPLTASANDVRGRGIEAIFNDDGPVDMASAEVVFAWGHDQKRDLQGVEPFTPKGGTQGTFDVYYPGPMQTVPGTVTASIIVTKSAQKIFEIPLPPIIVPDRAVIDPSALPSDNTFSMFSEALIALKEGIADVTEYTSKAAEAADAANAAATAANDAAGAATEAAGKANAATSAADAATAKANKAASDADASKEAADEATKKANEAASAAESATSSANDAADAANAATSAANEATEEAEAAEAKREDAEAARERAEGERVAAEEKRGSDFTASQNANKQAFDAAQNERASAFTAAQDERTQTFEASEKSRQDTFDAAEEKREAGEKERSDAEALREDAERKRAEKAAADANAEAARVEAEKLRVAAENARVEADGDRSTRQAANDTAQAKNNADQAANNKAAQGLEWVDLTEEQLDPDTRTPNFDGEFGKLYFAPAKNPTETDAATEWMWKPTGTGGRWEHVGTSETILPAGIGQEKVQQIHDGEQLSGNGIMYEADLAVYQALLNQDHAGHAKAQKAKDDAQDAAIKSVEASVTAAEAKAASDLADAVQSQGTTDEAQDTEIEAAKAAAKAAQDAIGPAITASETGLKKWVADEAKAHDAESADVAGKIGTVTVGSASVPVWIEEGVPKEAGSIPKVPGVATTQADGLLPKLSGKAAEFLNGEGKWVVITAEPSLPDPRALKASIATATSKKDAAKVQGSGDYDFGTQVTTQAELDKLAKAIEAAQAVVDGYGETVFTQHELDDAKSTLDAAVAAFEKTLKPLEADKSGLTAQESRYTTLKTGVTTSTNGKDVTFGSKWVTSAEQSAADTALSTARAAVEAATKQSQINAAVSTLTSALDTYQAAIKTATKDTAALDAAISAANAAKADVQASDSEGADLPAGSKYVTTEQMTTFTAAISAATTAKTASTTQAQLDAATSTLTSATSTFEGQVKTNRPSIPSDQSAFNATSWEDMALLSADCAKVGASDYQKLLGFTKDVAVAGVGTVKARLIGLNHDDLVSGGKAGFTFQLTDGLSTSAPASFQMNSSDTNSGGWASSLMRSTNLPKLKAALPADLQGVIKKVTKKTSTANSGTAVSDTEDDLFLLSLVESIGTTKTAYTDNPVASNNYLNFEGTQYEYYKQFDGNKTEAFNHHIINQASGSAQGWWLRSILLGNTTFFYLMNSSGDWNNYGASDAYLPAAGFAL